MKEILIVTGNQNKVREFKVLLEPLGFQVKSLADFHDDEDVPEYGTTFAENAVIKAEHGMKKYGVAAVADDSGLCVHALNDEPGIRSARFMGRDTSYDVKNRALIEMVKDKEDRGAAFHCAIALAVPGKETKVFEGVMEGQIAYELSGSNGFGYDPIFWLPERGMTSASLTTEEKNAISHRGKATRMLLEYLKENHLDISIGETE